MIMKFVNCKTAVASDDLFALLSNSDRVNDGVKFDEKRGKPFMNVKRKGTRIYITCRMMGGASKDNGFIVGTFFVGRMTEKNGVTRISGITLTSPLYHLLLLALTVFFIYRCIVLGGFNPVPVILLIFGLLLCKDEYKKQGIIARYIARAVRKSEM